MRPDEILNMLQRLERIFVFESSKIEMNSQILMNNIADQKAELKFHMLMLKIMDKPETQIAVEEGGLISLQEFIEGLQSNKNLYQSLLPRTLSF